MTINICDYFADLAPHPPYPQPCDSCPLRPGLCIAFPQQLRCPGGAHSQMAQVYCFHEICNTRGIYTCQNCHSWQMNQTAFPERWAGICHNSALQKTWTPFCHLAEMGTCLPTFCSQQLCLPKRKSHFALSLPASCLPWVLRDLKGFLPLIDRWACKKRTRELEGRVQPWGWSKLWSFDCVAGYQWLLLGVA